SYIADGRAITSRGPWVIGSNVPGQIARRLSGAMYPDQRVAVAALVQEHHRFEFERCSPIALDDDASRRCQHRGQRSRELRSEVVRTAVWGVEEHQIVLTRGFACAAKKPERVLPMELGVDLERLEVAADRSDCDRRTVDQRRRGGPARDRLDR